MKTKSLLLSIALMMLAINLGACAQSKNSENGSSTKTVKNYSIDSFTEIKSEIVGNIIFTQGEQTLVRAEGTQKEIDNILVTCEDGKLIFQSNVKNQKGKSNLTVYITSPNITKINHQGVGTFTLKDKVSLENLEIDFDGVGNLSAEDLECKNLEAGYQGVGNMKLKGLAVNVKLKTEGVGSTDAKEFYAEHLDVKASGVGSVKCRASKTIAISSEGVGGVTYWGNPEIKNINKEGIGKVKAAE
ncbi:MAG: DUF2807 domain-containing protein [Proteiniphilum sp.]|nr:DUF2807 domain-containing protein [Proteiniphilum sp.]